MAGSAKIPAPMTELITRKTKSHLWMPRLSDVGELAKFYFLLMVNPDCVFFVYVDNDSSKMASPYNSH